MLIPPLDLGDAMYQYKEEGEPGHVVIGIPMESTAVEQSGFSDFIESMANLGSKPNVKKYTGGRTTLRAKIIVLSNRLPLERQCREESRTTLVPGLLSLLLQFLRLHRQC